jgi:hypothetical protein
MVVVGVVTILLMARTCTVHASAWKRLRTTGTVIRLKSLSILEFTTELV